MTQSPRLFDRLVDRFLAWAVRHALRRAAVARDECGERPLCNVHAFREGYWLSYAKRTDDDRAARGLPRVGVA